MPIDRYRAFGLMLFAMGWTNAAVAEAPLSAIDWLSQSIVTPAAQPLPRVSEPAVVKGGVVPGEVTTSTLDKASPDAVGILAPEVTGLPRNLWGMGLSTDIAATLGRERVQDLPALQGLMITLLLAEADPPADAGSDGKVLLARIDALLAMGALDQARALLDATGPATSPEIFRRFFDVALLIGDEPHACEALKSAPGLSPSVPVRVFCLARAGDYDTAYLTLDTAVAIGSVEAGDATLLTRFLDPSLDDNGATLQPKGPMTPLTMRLFEAIGQPLPLATLPIAFSYADLSENAGWKAQIEAAERLSRAGAVSPNLLLGLYTQQKPAASGGVWDRVTTFQKLDHAVTAADLPAVEQTLPAAWSVMAGSELEVPLAGLYADRLMKMALTGEAADIAFELGLLSSDYEAFATVRKATSPQESFLIGVAKGDLTGVVAPDGMARAIAAAFVSPAVPDTLAPLFDQKRIGELILNAVDLINHGTTGDLRGVTDGLSVLRKIGMEDVARRTALQLILLDRRG